MIFTQSKNSQILIILLSIILVSLLWTQESFAQERAIELTFSSSDEFGMLLGVSPQVHIVGCDVYRMSSVRPHTMNTYKADLYYDSANQTQNCQMYVSAPGFITSETLNIGNFENDASFEVAKTFQLKHALVVDVSDTHGRQMPKMDIYFGGVSPRYDKDGVYYFAPRSNGALDISHPAYIKKTGKTDAQLGAVLVSREAVTYITLTGSQNCTSTNSSRNISCGGMIPLLSLNINDETGAILYDGKVELFKDRVYSKLGTSYIGGIEYDAQSIVGFENTNMGVLPGTYYVKVTKPKYEIEYGMISVNGNEQKNATFGLVRETSSTASSRRSIVTTNRVSAVANGIDTIIVNIVVRSSDDTTLKGREVVVTTGNTDDGITFDQTNVTPSNGSVTAYITAHQKGSRLINVTVDGVLLSQFPRITFEGVDDASKPDATESFITQTASPILGDGIETVDFTVTARNDAGIPLSMQPVTITTSRQASDIITCDLATKDNGEVGCSFSSLKAGTSILTVAIGDVIIDKIAISISPVPE